VPLLDPAEARNRFCAARVARFATAGSDERPHVVPICFAIDGDVIYSAVDAKPKRSPDLRRLRNIAENPHVALLADHYDDDWMQLWWARADGMARVVERDDPLRGRAAELLARRYEQYRESPPRDRAVVVEVERWSGWSWTA
jgi:PPOX class probable F420-dependent enzyme